MPIYEYECLTCGTTFEKRQSFSDEPRADCPNGHKETRRLLAAPAIVFKGSGFYVTDNKSNKNGVGSSTKDENSKDKSEKAESTASESKQKAEAKGN